MSHEKKRFGDWIINFANYKDQNIKIRKMHREIIIFYECVHNEFWIVNPRFFF